MKDYLVIIILIVIALVVFTLMWRRGMFLRLSGYVQETMDELKKCTWPTWEELNGSTWVVIVSVVLLGLFTVGVDVVVANAVRFLIQTH